MDFLKVESEYKWVLKVLNSCLNITQIKVTDLLFKTYKQKWSYEISDIKLMTINSDYERQKLLRVNEIQKNQS
jgi:hypothetical protein